MIKKTKKQNFKKLFIISLGAIALLVVAFSIKTPGSKTEDSSNSDSLRTKKVVDENIVIPVSDITKTAKFFPAKINGTDLEVLAAKAPDGTIRTAFNTCQVCYSSGKGYYVQEGDVLVCQNCGNRFSMDQVQITKGGCNPVPITDEYKTVSDSTITISKDVLTEATAIFKNWK